MISVEMPNQNQSRKNRIARMLKRKRPTLKRQYGQRNLFASSANQREINNNGFTLRRSLVNPNNNAPQYNNKSNENQQYLNEYLNELQAKHNAEVAYQMRPTLSGRWNRFRQSRKQNKKEAAYTRALLAQL